MCKQTDIYFTMKRYITMIQIQKHLIMQLCKYILHSTRIRTKPKDKTNILCILPDKT